MKTIFADLMMSLYVFLSVVGVVGGLMRDHRNFKNYKVKAGN